MTNIRYVEAPEAIRKDLPRPFVFLAGGITRCPDWQSEAISMIFSSATGRCTVLNPRRHRFPIDDPGASREQIEWEFAALGQADIVCFWFSRGSANPIVFFEYGTWLTHGALVGRPRVIVGCDPKFSRRRDVEIQTSLRDRTILVHGDVSALVIKLLALIRPPYSGPCRN